MSDIEPTNQTLADELFARPSYEAALKKIDDYNTLENTDQKPSVEEMTAVMKNLANAARLLQKDERVISENVWKPLVQKTESFLASNAAPLDVSDRYKVVESVLEVTEENEEVLQEKDILTGGVEGLLSSTDVRLLEYYQNNKRSKEQKNTPE